MLRKVAFLLLLLIFINIDLAYATTGYKYVDGFTSTYLEWIEYGSSPYLSAIDYPTNYIYLGINQVGKKEGNFSFSDSTALEKTYTLTDVKVQFYGYGEEDIDIGPPTVSVCIYDGSTWSPEHFVEVYAGFAWYSTVTLFDHVSTWTELDAALIYVKGYTSGTMQILIGDCARLIITYTTGGTSYTFYLSGTQTLTAQSSKRIALPRAPSASQTLNAEAAKRFFLSRPHSFSLSMTPETLLPRFTFSKWAGTTLSFLTESFNQFFRPINIYASSVLTFLSESSYGSTRLLRILGISQLDINVFSISNLPIPETNYLLIPILFLGTVLVSIVYLLYKKD